LGFGVSSSTNENFLLYNNVGKEFETVTSFQKPSRRLVYEEDTTINT